MKNRSIKQRLQDKAGTHLGRILVLTGARQTGKTTLVQAGFDDYVYISLEDPVARPDFLALSGPDWYRQYPMAVLDEVQKAPRLIESVKAVYDRYDDARYILLGSSQILLMEKVKESLAGRAALAELYPFTLPEMLTSSWSDPVVDSRLIQWLRDRDHDTDVFSGIPRHDDRQANVRLALRDYLEFGAMPTVVDDRLSPEEKNDWLADYNRTYLQRDVRDLVNLRELEPFVRAHRTLSELTGRLVNVDNLATRAGIAPKTAKRFISYLEMSYQVILLQPWTRNPTKRLAKTPKLHFLDPGVQRAVLNRRGSITGEEFESAVVSEIHKQIKNNRIPVDIYHLRTSDGREVDLLLELDEGFVAIEIKMAARVSSTDARHLRDLGAILDKPVLHAFLLSSDERIQTMGDGITAMPVGWFLS